MMFHCIHLLYHRNHHQLLLPLAKPFEKASRKLIKDDNNQIERGAEIKAMDETFDPNVHNAVMTESLEEKEDGTITKVG